MRPIDADELKEGLSGHFKEVMGNFIFNTTFAELEAIIDTAPPVEPQKIVTIPPELIEKLASCVVGIVGNIDWEKAIEAYKVRPQDEIIKELWNCRNELCLKCERYKQAYRGACEDCRYNFKNMEKWKEAEND